MTNRQANKLKMTDLVISVCDNHSAVIATIPALETALTQFKNLISEIHFTLRGQVLIISGITMDKKQVKERCAQQIVKVSKAIAAYAHVINDHELEEAMTFYESKLKRTRGQTLMAIANNVSNAASFHAADIVPYGIDAADIDELNDAIINFNEIMMMPKIALDNRKVHTKQLQLLFAEADELLKNKIDRLVYVLPSEHNDFKLLYTTTRKIDNYRGKRLKHKTNDSEKNNEIL